jgi:hypothetical protein
MPWIGKHNNRIRRFFVNKNASRVNTMLKSSAEYVTPHRIGGRVAPTNRGSAVRPVLSSLTMDP